MMPDAAPIMNRSITARPVSRSISYDVAQPMRLPWNGKMKASTSATAVAIRPALSASSPPQNSA